MFSCLSMADQGGESPIVFNRDLIRDLDPSVVEKFRQLGVRYFRNIEHRQNTNYICWQNAFDATTEDVRTTAFFLSFHLNIPKDVII